jgi:hypothetical protein
MRMTAGTPSSPLYRRAMVSPLPWRCEPKEVQMSFSLLIITLVVLGFFFLFRRGAGGMGCCGGGHSHGSGRASEDKPADKPEA